MPAAMPDQASGARDQRRRPPRLLVGHRAPRSGRAQRIQSGGRLRRRRIRMYVTTAISSASTRPAARIRSDELTASMRRSGRGARRLRHVRRPVAREVVGPRGRGRAAVVLEIGPEVGDVEQEASLGVGTVREARDPRLGSAAHVDGVGQPVRVLPALLDQDLDPAIVVLELDHRAHEEDVAGRAGRPGSSPATAQSAATGATARPGHEQRGERDRQGRGADARSSTQARASIRVPPSAPLRAVLS